MVVFPVISLQENHQEMNLMRVTLSTLCMLLLLAIIPTTLIKEKPCAYSSRRMLMALVDLHLACLATKCHHELRLHFHKILQNPFPALRTVKITQLRTHCVCRTSQSSQLLHPRATKPHRMTQATGVPSPATKATK